MSDVCVIGSFVMDTCVLVDEFPLPGQTVIARKVRYSAGGKGCNQCVAAARLHADCEMIGMLGSDEAGKTFLELLQKEGIRHEHVTMCSHAPTGFHRYRWMCGE
ncbi:MAG: PfkB family carbohydrate kinase [[Clostridium] innocuum]